MGMTQAQFDRLVQQLEHLAKKRPDQYKLRVRCLAWLGYGYIIVVLGFMITLSMWYVPKLLSIFESVRSMRLLMLVLLFGVGTPMVIVYSILDALCFHIPSPEGLEVSAKKVPSLFQLLRSLQKELRTPPFHHVLLTNEFNAAVSQVPNFGFFGGYRNYLIIGLPLLQTLSPGQFRAVLAHELGHLSAKHGQFGHWIYRVRQTWYQLLSGLQDPQQSTGEGMFDLMLALASLIGRGAFVLFFQWYAPFFAAYSFVLARADEYEADRYAAKLAGAKNLASALVNSEIAGGYVLPSFWQRIAAKVDQQVDPPEPYTELAQQVQHPIALETVKPLLKQAMAQATNTEDTHPCLKDRLGRIGCKPNQVLGLVKPLKTSAAEQFLGKALPGIVKHFNEVWQGSVTHEWRQRYQDTQHLQQKLESLNSEEEGSLSLEQRWERARLTVDTQDAAAALPDLQAILAEQPDHFGANMLLGQLLLEQGDRTGINHLEKVMTRHGDAYTHGANLIYAFLQQHEGEDTAAQYLQQAREQSAVVDKARLERARFTHHHAMVVPDLPAKMRQTLQQQLGHYPEVKTAYLVQKVVQYLPEQPFYVLAIELTPAAEDDRGQSVEIIMDRLAKTLTLPRESMLMRLDSEHTALKVKLRQMAGAEVLG
ncbi:MAG: M48 family metalloprotease [Leptolyngbyaceae cyanobacterium]